MQLSDAELKLISSILKTHLGPRSQVWVFGSRARGDARPNSDLDLLFDPALTLVERALINEDFENSQLLFEVDLVNRCDLAAAYQAQVEEEKKRLL